MTTKSLSTKKVRSLLKEGREVRSELETRVNRMHRTPDVPTAREVQQAMKDLERADALASIPSIEVECPHCRHDIRIFIR